MKRFVFPLIALVLGTTVLAGCKAEVAADPERGKAATGVALPR